MLLVGKRNERKCGVTAKLLIVGWGVGEAKPAAGPSHTTTINMDDKRREIMADEKRVARQRECERQRKSVCES